MARPRKEPLETRTARLNLRVTAGERAQLAAAAGAAGLGLADYARQSLLAQVGLGSPPKAVVMHRLDATAISALTRVGANLNQLARRANAGDLLQPGELPEALAALDRQLTRIEALVLPAIDP